MKSLTVSRILKAIGRNTKKYGPEILTGLGVAGMISGGIWAVIATPKAIKCIEEKKEELEKDDLTVKETVEATWKCYAPAAATSILSASCIIFASSSRFKRNAALATAYSLSETTLKEYQNKVTEFIGEEKEKDIRDSIAEDKIRNKTSSEIVVTGNGEVLCYEASSGQLFMSDPEKIREARNIVNNRINRYGSLSANEWYDEIGINHSSIGDLIGWNDDMGLVEISFASRLVYGDKPCLVLDYAVPPKYGFDRY